MKQYYKGTEISAMLSDSTEKKQKDVFILTITNLNFFDYLLIVGNHIISSYICLISYA